MPILVRSQHAVLLEDDVAQCSQVLIGVLAVVERGMKTSSSAVAEATTG
jgi:hypothetical protein